MSDYISRQAAIDALNELSEHYTEKGREWHPHIDHVLFEIQSLPSADVRENVRGEWIWISSTYDRKPCEMVYECNKCHHKTIVQSLGMDSPWEKFCPNCGADMRGENDDR